MGPTQQGLGKGTGLGFFQPADVKGKAVYQTQRNPTFVKHANMCVDLIVMHTQTLPEGHFASETKHR